MPSPGRWGHPPVPSQGWGPPPGARASKQAATRTANAGRARLGLSKLPPPGQPMPSPGRWGHPPVPSQGWGPPRRPSPVSKPRPGPPSPGGPDLDSASFRHRDNPCRHPAAGATPQCPHKDGALPGARCAASARTIHALTRPSRGTPPGALTRMVVLPEYPGRPPHRHPDISHSAGNLLDPPWFSSSR